MFKYVTYQSIFIPLPPPLGGYPTVPSNARVAGADLGITSDGFFLLEQQPKRVAIVGTGYIAVEIGGVFNALGSDVTIFSRTNEILRTFDPIIKETLLKEMTGQGVKLVPRSNIEELKPIGPAPEGAKGQGQPVSVRYTTDGTIKEEEFDVLLWAIGRSPNVEGLGLAEVGVQLNSHGFILTDEYQNTTTENIYALGDVCGVALLTPGTSSFCIICCHINVSREIYTIFYSRHRRRPPAF